MKKFEQDGQTWWEFEAHERDIHEALEEDSLLNDLMQDLVYHSFDVVLRYREDDKDYTLPENYFDLLVRTQHKFRKAATSRWDKVRELMGEDAPVHLSYSHLTGKITPFDPENAA